MDDIAVSFFSEPHVQSRTRRVSFPHAARRDLHDAICRAMTGSEFFACYLTPDGSVIALDRQGVTIIPYRSDIDQRRTPSPLNA